ncbi:MAG: formate dehydrogenase accessory sulfurtransferase FdhD [Syntrophobacteraceae bacterium]
MPVHESGKPAVNDERRRDFSMEHNDPRGGGVYAENADLVPVRIYSGAGDRTEKSQWVVRERPVTLYFGGREVVTLLCAGHHLDELAVGFFHAEGFLREPGELKEVRVDEEAGRVDVHATTDGALAERLWSKRTISSGCGKGSVFYHALDALMSKPVSSALEVSGRQVLERMEDLRQLSETYRHTHGVHNTVLATPERVVLFRDDIGRHNAVDMIVGHAFLKGIRLDDKLLLTTGRLTSEILIKAAKVGIPVLISRNTATSLAIQLAESLAITLVGYVRGGRFTVYTGDRRIVFDSAEGTGAGRA